VLAQLRRGVNDCRRMDSGGIARWLVKQFDGLGPARYGFLLRNMPASMAGKFSETITAEAFVIFAAALYLGLRRTLTGPVRHFDAGYPGDFSVG